MEDTVLKKIEDLRNSRNTKYTIVYSDGTLNNDDYYKASFREVEHDVNRIGITLYEAAKSYSRNDNFDFDSISMYLRLGLVFHDRYVDSNGTLTPDAVPLEGIVRYDTASVTGYLYGKKTNENDYGEYGTYTYNGYIAYDDMVKSFAKQGLTFHGPETFEDFKRRVMNGQKFPTTVSANLGLEKEMQLTLR